MRENGPGPGWRAEYRAELRLEPAERAPEPADPAWKPLRQAWHARGEEKRFQPGWARLSWNEGGLLFDIVLTGRNPRNSARRMNERTWELGDIAEIFLQKEASEEYLELHITPENQRLQLRWTIAGFASFRRDSSRFGEFTVSDPEWVGSVSRVREADWSASAFIPARALNLGQPSLGPEMLLRGAVCRYDCTAGPDIIFSSTAGLREPSYHRREEWDRLALALL